VEKVFCIGFHKTGTTSLAHALAYLGYSVTGPNFVNDQRIHSDLWALARPLIEQFDAFQDNPWPVLFRQIFRSVPGARFILTERHPDDWIRSASYFFSGQSTEMRRLIYGAGSPEGNLDNYLAVYNRHYADVQAYFEDRPSKLLRMNLFVGAEWAPLCAFLGKPKPDAPFPHVRPASPAKRVR